MSPSPLKNRKYLRSQTKTKIEISNLTGQDKETNQEARSQMLIDRNDEMRDLKVDENVFE